MTSIRHSILKGTLFTGLSKYISLGVNLIVTAILARILPPEDFGIVALTTVFTSFFDILATAGMVPAIIQNNQIIEDEYSDLFSFSMLMAFVVCIIYIVLIVPVSNFFAEDRLRLLLLFLSVQLFFNTLNVVPQASILKDKNFRLLAIISSSGAIFWGIISIILAFTGIGIYALIITPIGMSCSNFFLNYFLCGKMLKIRLKYSKASVKKIMSFSLYQLSFNFVNFFSRNLDKLLLGKFLGMSSLGYYEKSYKLMTLPISTLTNVLTPTVQPVLANYQNEQKTIHRVYLNFSDTLMLLGFVVAPFLFFASRECILLVFGPQWENAISVFKVLSISVPFQLVDSISGSIFQSTNKVKYLFKSGFICAIVNILFLIVGLVTGQLMLVAIFVTISLFLNFLISAYYINKLVFNSSITEYLRFSCNHLPVALAISIILFFEDKINYPIILTFTIKAITSVILFYLYCKIRKVRILNI